MNKKGFEMGTSMIILIILAGIFVFLIVNYMENQSSNLKKTTDNYIRSLQGDYDGDGIKDFKDKSPCVPGEELVTAGDKKYYYYSEPHLIGGKPSCDLKYFPNLKKDHPEAKLKLVTETSTNKKLCVLERNTCSDWLKEENQEKT